MLKQIARRILRKELEEQEKKAMTSYLVFRGIISAVSYDKETGMKLLEEMVKEANSKVTPPVDLLIFEANAAKLFFVENGEVLPSGVKIQVNPPDCSKESGMYLSVRAIIAVNSKNAGLTKQI